jgi:hypothetical protein
MKRRMQIEMLDDKRAFAPGETIQGVVSWQSDKAPKELRLHLLYHTQGKGDEDAAIVETVDYPSPSTSGVEPFNLTAPAGPHSFSGRLISLGWALELVTERKGDVARVDLTIAPDASEIELPAIGKIE